MKWWKILCIILLVYVHIAGLIVPLRQGIVSIDKLRCDAGEVCDIAIKIYHGAYDEDEKIEAYLKFDTSYYVAATEVKMISHNEVLASFKIPDYLPSSSEAIYPSLLVSTEADGAIILPRALSLAQDSVTRADLGVALWSIKEKPELFAKDYFAYPYRNILVETLRCLYYHVPMWFSMMLLFGISAWHSLMILLRKEWNRSDRVYAMNAVGLLLGILGIITGMVWAHNAWGKFWSWDIKQTTSAICLFMYAAYFFLYAGVRDEMQKIRLTSAYNLFCFAMMIPLLFLIPRMMDSLHPGNGGNPAFAQDDLDNTMRLVFYPAVVGYMLLSYWIAQVYYRVIRLHRATLDR